MLQKIPRSTEFMIIISILWSKVNMLISLLFFYFQPSSHTLELETFKMHLLKHQRLLCVFDSDSVSQPNKLDLEISLVCHQIKVKSILLIE